MELLTLLKANLRHRKSTFISIFVLMMIVSMILTSALSISNNLNCRVTQANDETGTGDLVVYIFDNLYDKKMQSQLRRIKPIKITKVVDSFLSSDIVINGKKPDATIYFSPYNNQEQQYGIFNDDTDAFIDQPACLNDGQIYLPVALKNMCSCKNGDIVSIEYYGKTVEFTIAGFIEDPFTGCDVINTKNLFITQSDFDRIRNEVADMSISMSENVGKILPFKQIHIYARAEYKNNIDELCRIIRSKTEIIDRSFSTISREQAQRYTLLLPLILCGVLYLFLVLLIIVVAMVLSNNIGSSIEMDYVNIGILKSQGFSKEKIRLVMLVQYLLPSVIGSAVGLLLSIAVVDFIRPIFIKASCLLVSNEIMFGRSIAILLVILTLICLFIYAKTAKVSKISPVRAISGGLEDVHFSSILRTPVMGRSKALTGVRLAMRQLTSNIRQYISTGIIFAVLVCYLSACVAFKENFTETFYDELYGTTSGDICVEYGGNEDASEKVGLYFRKIKYDTSDESKDMREEVEAEISAISPVTGSFAYSDVDFFMDGVSYTAQVLDDLSYLNKIIDGKEPQYDNEILITNFLSSKINKTIGDKVIIECNDDSREFIICGTYDSISAGGSTFAITFEAAKTVMPGLEPLKRYYTIEDTTQAEIINQRLDEKFNSMGIKTVNAKKQNPSTISTVMGVMNAMILFIFIIAVIFSVITIWMVCTKSFLKERIDIGIYKAYGFSSLSLKMQFCFRYLIVALAASVIGAVLYTFFGDALNYTTLMSLGITEFHAPRTITSYVIPPAIICLFVFISSFITMGKINKVSTKELVVE